MLAEAPTKRRKVGFLEQEPLGRGTGPGQCGLPGGGGVGVTFEASVSGMVGWSSEEFWAGAKHVVLVSLMESEKKCPHQHQAS